MSKFFALHLPGVRATMIIEHIHFDMWRLHSAIVPNSLYELAVPTIMPINQDAVADFHKQTLYGFVPMFFINVTDPSEEINLTDLEALAAAHKPAGDPEVHYVSATEPTVVHSVVLVCKSIEYPDDGGEVSFDDELELDGLNYFIDTAFFGGAIDMEFQDAHFGKLMDLVPPVEVYHAGQIVQLIGDNRSVAMGRIVSTSPLGSLIRIDSIAAWAPTDRVVFEVRTVNTKRIFKDSPVMQREGLASEWADGAYIEYVTVPENLEGIYLGAGVQPAPGHKFFLTEFEMVLESETYYPRVNVPFSYDNELCAWRPMATLKLAENFANSVMASLNKLVQVVGKFEITNGNGDSLVATDGVKLEFHAFYNGADFTPARSAIVDTNNRGYN